MQIISGSMLGPGPALRADTPAGTSGEQPEPTIASELDTFTVAVNKQLQVINIRSQSKRSSHHRYACSCGAHAVIHARDPGMRDGYALHKRACDDCRVIHETRSSALPERKGLICCWWAGPWVAASRRCSAAPRLHMIIMWVADSVVSGAGVCLATACMLCDAGIHAGRHRLAARGLARVMSSAGDPGQGGELLVAP